MTTEEEEDAVLVDSVESDSTCHRHVQEEEGAWGDARVTLSGVIIDLKWP
jgi:hypothetical protein